MISAYEFDASPQDVALRNISRVSAAAHMPFIGAVGPAFFLKETMEEVAAIKDIGNYFDRAEYIRWKAFRETDDARYIGLVMPRVLGRLPYGPDTVPVRSFNYVEQVKGPDHEKYLWTSAAFSFASNMVKSFVNNGWCVQIRGPQAGGAVKICLSICTIWAPATGEDPFRGDDPETREFEFASRALSRCRTTKSRLRLLLLGQLRAETGAVRYRRRHRQQPHQRASALHLPAVAHRALPEDDPARKYRHHQGPASAGAGAEHRVRSPVTEMTDPGDELQASHPLRDASVVVEDIEDNPGFFRVKLYAVPHFRSRGWTSICRWLARCQRRRRRFGR